MERAYDDAKYGRPSEEPIILGLIPSLTSPDMAPEGKHIMSCNVWHAPVELTQGSWKVERGEMASRCIEIISRSIPDLKDRIIDYRALSPLDLENEFGLRDGNIMHLEMMPTQMFGLRPLADCSAYKTPTKGLYLCGSGTWPGGTVSGIPGHNAAHTILNHVEMAG
jgi:phytoene dehydrogenase-like protein